VETRRRRETMRNRPCPPFGYFRPKPLPLANLATTVLNVQPTDETQQARRGATATEAQRDGGPEDMDTIEELLKRIEELENELEEEKEKNADRETYRELNGRCEDAPCCGCCGNWE
jgi:hypothetical protein